MSNGEDLSNLSMTDLFRMELESQVAVLNEGLLAVERNPNDLDRLKDLMRAAHSIKGAARLVGDDSIVRVAHAIEDAFVAAQEGRIILGTGHIDVLLGGVDLIVFLSQSVDASFTGSASRNADSHVETDIFLETLAAVMRGEALSGGRKQSRSEQKPKASTPSNKKASSAVQSAPTRDVNAEPVSAAPSAAAVRVSAERLNNLLAFAGESLVASRWIMTFSKQLMHLKGLHNNMVRSLDAARELAATSADESVKNTLHGASIQAAGVYESLIHAMGELDAFDRRSLRVSSRMYEEVLAARMRPFSDGIQGIPRMARDVSRTLGKNVRVKVEGENTPVDRDILQRMETPIIHLIRNLIDHGIESPQERIAAGKPEEGTALIQARHSAGMLIVSVSDDGKGIDSENIRRTVVERRLTSPDVASKLTEQELLEFLFLPGFSTKENVTEISGRGVGLDAVMTAVREVGGNVEILSEPKIGTRVQMHLPLTLSVVRALIFDVAGDPYAIPLTRVARVVKIPRDAVQSMEGRQHFLYEDRLVGIVSARQILTGAVGALPDGDIPVVVIGDKLSQYGLVVDSLSGERELVVRPLDPRLGKVPSVSAASILPDGVPVLIVDVDDLIRSVEVVVSGGRLLSLNTQTGSRAMVRRRKVLVVDDSITVRETERKLLEGAGYEVDVAVDGMDGWNAVRTGSYDLVVTDVDMPRMNGIELTTLIRKDARLKSLPVMIVSYKDREEDRMRGLEAGADYYLTKASFHDDTLLNAAADLIGVAESGTIG